MTGKLIMKQNRVTGGQKLQAASLPDGVYLVVVDGKDTFFTQRIIKE
jgi:hypothetical protein